MKTLEESINRVVVCDSVSDELQKLRLIYTFLSQISDVSYEEGIQFIGRWNVRYFEAAILTLGESIDSIEEIIHPEEVGTNLAH